MIIVESRLMVTMISEEIIFYLLVKSNPTRSFLSRPSGEVDFPKIYDLPERRVTW